MVVPVRGMRRSSTRSTGESRNWGEAALHRNTLRPSWYSPRDSAARPLRHSERRDGHGSTAEFSPSGSTVARPSAPFAFPREIRSRRSGSARRVREPRRTGSHRAASRRLGRTRCRSSQSQSSTDRGCEPSHDASAGLSAAISSPASRLSSHPTAIHPQHARRPMGRNPCPR